MRKALDVAKEFETFIVLDHEFGRQVRNRRNVVKSIDRRHLLRRHWFQPGTLISQLYIAVITIILLTSAS